MEESAVEASTQDPHIKSLQIDQAPLQQQSGDEQETSSLVVSREMDWHEHFSLLQKHDESLDRIGGRSSNCSTVSQSQSSNGPGVVVEELTMKSFKSPSMSLGGDSTSGEKSPVGSRVGRSFSRTSCGASTMTSGSNSIASPDDATNSSVAPFGTSKRGNFVASANGAMKSPEETRTKVMPSSSGFLQFFTQSKLKGKGVASRQQNKSSVHDLLNNPVHNRNTLRLDSELEETPNVSSKPNAKKDRTCLREWARVSSSSDEGIRLREWLKPKHRKINKVERMHMFKQIVDVVDMCHSQGIALNNLRPSYFVVMPVNQIRYIGSFSSQGQVVQKLGSTEEDGHHFKRKRYMERGNETRDISMPKHQRLRGPNGICFGHFGYPLGGGHRMESEDDENDVDCFRTRHIGYDPRELKLNDHHQQFNKSHGPSLSSMGTRHFMLDQLVKLEDRWYASPEELHNNICLFSSNIYSLGVLFFELFSFFETWEVHSAAMQDLRYRILPPSFLSESPKEAGFCLWLSHPDPSSRPTSRDILLSDLISRSMNFSSLGHSSALIEEEDAEADLLFHFLICLKEHKEKHAAKLVAGLGYLNTDIEEVEKRHLLRSEILTCGKGLPNNYNISASDTHQKLVVDESGLPTLCAYDERLMKNIDQLESAYFFMRSKIDIYETSIVTRLDNDVLKIGDKYCHIQNDVGENETADHCGAFFEGLCKYARYNKFEVRGSLKNVDILNSTNVICSLSFDRDEEYFAAAGVSRKIKIFEFDDLLDDNIDIHYPLIEMSSNSKLSCVCWNNYIKNYLASTDYDGVVQLWDACTGQGLKQLIEHQKRAWSVNFSNVDPTKLASGSDDCYVKVWSINERNSIDTIKNVANVCCVQFSSYSSHLLAFGSADYKIYCYDLRNTRIPWCTLSGHGKAVSYVKFLDSETLISASTDNSLKLWDLNKTSGDGLSKNACTMTLGGHTNERNFVGLSMCDGYITCGSETNEVYAYYRTFPMPIASYKFGSIDPFTAQETSDDNGQFVSSVCWRGKSNMVVAANSAGSIKVLQLV